MPVISDPLIVGLAERYAYRRTPEPKPVGRRWKERLTQLARARLVVVTGAACFALGWLGRTWWG